MAENCEVCGVKLENTNYKYCLKCINKVKEQNVMQDVLKKISGVEDALKHLNWNAGSISKFMKLSILNDIESSSSTEKGITKIQQSIKELLLKDLEKDLKQLNQIKEEQEK